MNCVHGGAQRHARIADAVIEGKNIRGVVAAEAVEEGVALPGIEGELEAVLTFEPGDSELAPELPAAGVAAEAAAPEDTAVTEVVQS